MEVAAPIFRAHYQKATTRQRFLLGLCALLLTTTAVAQATERLVTLKATITVKNTGDLPLNNYSQRLTIPANDHAQQRLLRIDTPYPDEYSLRPHDNGVDNYMKFKWDIPARSQFVRTVSFQLRLTAFDHRQQAIQKSSHRKNDFLAPSDHIESNSPEIRAIAQQIKAQHASPTAQLLAAFNYPQANLRYTLMPNQGALYALQRGVGDCTEYAAIFIGVSRALGIPARLSSEFNFSEGKSYSEPNHHAAEAYLDSAWVPVDPNLALNPALGYGFGTGKTNKVILKRGDSWVWSNSVPGTSREYRDQHIRVGISWVVTAAE